MWCGAGEPGVDADGSEELDTISTMARNAAVPSPVLDASREQHRLALDGFGPALGELLAVKLLEEQAGQHLRGSRS